MTLLHALGYLLVLGVPTVLCFAAWKWPPRDEVEKYLVRIMAITILIFVAAAIFILGICLITL